MSKVSKHQRILCPLDFSERSEHAFRYAEELATQLEAELIIAHAFDRPATMDFPGQTTPANQALREKLESVESTLPLERLLHAGPPGEVICWLAQENNCDLIVMGTHGRTGLGHVLFGSVAEYVLQHARCPVLTIRLRAENEPRLREPRVLPLPAPRMM